MFLKSHGKSAKMAFILVFCYGWMYLDLVLLAGNQKISLVKLPQDDGKYTSLCFSENSRKLYAINQSRGELHAWDLFNPKLENLIHINQSVHWSRLVPINQEAMMMANLKGEVWCANFKKQTLTRLNKPSRIEVDPVYVMSMAFDHKRSQLILVRGNGSVELLQYQGGEITKTSRIKLPYTVRCVAYSRDLTSFATADWSHNVNVLLTDDTKSVRKMKFSEKIYDLAFGPAKDLLTVSQADGTCWGIDTQQSQVKWKVSCRKRLLKTRVSQDEEYIYALVGNIRKKQSGAGTAGFHIHRVSDGQMVFQQKLKGDMPGALEVSPDGKFVAAQSAGEVYLWKLE